MNKLMTGLCVVGAVLAALIFFYPTPYRYEDGGLTRINRFTGTVQKAGGGGWEIAQATESPEKSDPITPEIVKGLEQVTVSAQDFDSITLHNPGPWGLVLIEKAEVSYDSACGAGASDYVTFITGDRSLDAGQDRVLRLPHSDSFKKRVTSACGGGSHKRTVLLILNSANNNTDGRRWDAQSRLVSRKVEGDLTIPAS